jgi:hypothetical protein
MMDETIPYEPDAEFLRKHRLSVLNIIEHHRIVWARHGTDGNLDDAGARALETLETHLRALWNIEEEQD